MTVQPSRTPAQQAVDDAIRAWRETSGIPVSQGNHDDSGADFGTIGVRKTAPGVASTNTEGLVQPSATKPTRSDVST